MTAKLIAQKLYDKGFDTKVAGQFVIVSLNRPISTTEVNAALDYEEKVKSYKVDKVIVMGA